MPRTSSSKATGHRRRDVYQRTQVRRTDRSRRTAIRERGAPAGDFNLHAPPGAATVARPTRRSRQDGDTHVAAVRSGAVARIARGPVRDQCWFRHWRQGRRFSVLRVKSRLRFSVNVCRLVGFRFPANR